MVADELQIVRIALLDAARTEIPDVRGSTNQTVELYTVTEEIGCVVTPSSGIYIE